MATQGMVTITDHAGVRFKIVAGCNGFNAPIVAKRVRDEPEADAERLRRIAVASGFGCPACLVVVGRSEVLCDDPEELSPLYRETFTKARFNPRWKSGVCGRLQIVRLKD